MNHNHAIFLLNWAVKIKDGLENRFKIEVAMGSALSGAKMYSGPGFEFGIMRTSSAEILGDGSSTHKEPRVQ